MTTAGIFNHATTAGQALAGMATTPMNGSTAGTSGTSGTNGADSSNDGSNGSATISANDFLTLLVTEMQNQDPTADTDPNEYIDQLVEVNSLEQLIDINQTLSGALDGTSESDASGSSAQAAGTNPGLTGASPAATTATPRTSTHLAGPSFVAQSGTAATQTTGAKRAPGNLSVPRASAAAHRVAHALDGRTHARPAAGGITAAQ
jgi:flagellar basal-body rod modification protein FlgD